MNHKKYSRSQVYGPVPSRRLGRSLGVDLVPPKSCSYECIYCQAGRTTDLLVEPVSYYAVEEVLPIVTERLAGIPAPDFITFSGNGEPTLNADIGTIIDEFKKRWPIPVAVITNGSLLHRPEVTKRILKADVVLPSLDAVTEETFHRMNRPHPDLSIETVIDGLRSFSHRFEGRLLLEVMLVGGINDSQEEMDKLLEVIRTLKLDEVQLNTVVRPPLEADAGPLDPSQLEAIRDRFVDSGIPCEVVAEFRDGGIGRVKSPDMKSVLDLLGRRPCALDEMAASLGYEEAGVKAMVEKLLHLGQITVRITGGKTYYSRK
ncbi:radical SAM protein [candidate division KSB1 bacterium]